MSGRTVITDRFGQPMRSASNVTRATSRYLRDSRSGVIAARPTSLRDSRDDIRQSWGRAAGLAIDVVQNSGRLKGAVDQVLADTVGVELQLSPQPNLIGLGYNDRERAELIRIIKARWKLFAWDPSECDFRGKFTLPQQIDIGLRWDMVYGEITGLLDYMSSATRSRYGITTGTKLCLTPPTRLVQDTSSIEDLFQGVYHDENGRPDRYLFEERVGGIVRKVQYPARDASGRPVVLHIFDPQDATDVRGISKLTSAFKKHLQHEMLDDATLQTAILQTVFAAVITSEQPEADAFEALEAIKGQKFGKDDDQVDGNEYAADMIAFLQSNLDRLHDNAINFSADPQISHLGPGEKFDIKTAGTPGGQYLPFAAALSRDMARAIGISYGGLTMDHSNATYSSVRMETSSIWPVVMRRRERVAAPLCQAVYENWLDEEIGEGRIPFKGGYRAYLANRARVNWAQWQGPAKPTADDNKSAKAASERIDNGTSSVEIEAADIGLDPDELFDQRLATHRRYIDAGMRSPYERNTRPSTGDPGDEEPATKVDVK
ncbi:phage portal protein [Roseibium alexandrii]|uniref:phage portal protein n=1 Tax=Roseibium alexandrii TaxID=388408 RepID=UPI0037500D68